MIFQTFKPLYKKKEEMYFDKFSKEKKNWKILNDRIITNLTEL